MPDPGHDLLELCSKAFDREEIIASVRAPRAPMCRQRRARRGSHGWRAAVTCVWVGVEGDELLTADLNPRQRKLENVRRDPRVTLSFEGTRIRPPGLREFLVGHENVTLGRPGATDTEIEEAMRRAGLGDWLASLPGGLDTDVGDQGARVSGGQRQRIATARALLFGGRHLVLDEPTAHLDPEAARALLAELAATAKRTGAGILVITHEHAGLEPFDEVLGLRAGRIVSRRL